MSRKLKQANKRLRQIPPVSAAAEDQEGEDEDFVSTGLEKWLKRLAKGIQTPRTTQGRLTSLTTTQTRPSTSGTRPPLPPKPPTLRKKLIEEFELTPPTTTTTTAKSKGKGKGKTLITSVKEPAVEGLKRAFIGSEEEELGRGKRKRKPKLAFTPTSTKTTQARKEYIATGQTPASLKSKIPTWKAF